MTAKARERDDLVELDGAPGDDAAYSAANRAIVEQAKALARGSAHQGGLIAIVVWNGAPRRSSDATKESNDLVEASGFRVTEVQTLGR